MSREEEIRDVRRVRQALDVLDQARRDLGKSIGVELDQRDRHIGELEATVSTYREALERIVRGGEEAPVGHHDPVAIARSALHPREGET